MPDHFIPLTPEGFIQASQTGVAMREKYALPDYIYHSGYCRAEQTAIGILEAFTPSERAAIKVRMNQFVRERDPGYCYDMTQQEAEAAFPWLADYWKTFGGYMARPPGGESLADVSNRVYTFLNMLFRDRARQRIWVVTHGGTIRAFRFLLERWSYERALSWGPFGPPTNCGVTVYTYDQNAGKLKLREYNTVYWDN